MSTGYNKHRDQVEQARQTDGKFGSYSADESAVTLERHPESAAADEAMRQRIPAIFSGPYEDHGAVEKIDSFLSTQPDERIAIRQAVEQLQPDDPYDEEQWETFDDRMDYVAESILDGGLENRDVSQLAADAMDEHPSDSDSGEVTLSSGVTVEVNAEGEAESSSPGTAEDNLIGNGPLAHVGGHELLGNDGFAYNEGINRATKAASEGKIAVVHSIDKYLDDGGDANNNIPTGMEVGYREYTPEDWESNPYGSQTFDSFDAGMSHEIEDDLGDEDDGYEATRIEELETPENNMIDASTGERERDTFLVFKPRT